jgi:NADH-quinone oxidoreductase subunit L
MLRIIVFAPLVGAVILGLFGKKMSERLIGIIACSAIAVSVVSAFAAFTSLLSRQPDPDGVRRISDTLFNWMNVGQFRLDFGYLLDPLSGVMILFVTGVGFLIHIFATGYMHGEESFYRFFTYMNLFMFMMLNLVLGENFVMMFVGWEGVGLCSYLLIGYYFLKDFANDAAKKAFIVNRIGDFGFALAMFLIFYKFGNLNFIDKNGILSALSQAAVLPVEPLAASAIFAGGLTTVAALLFVGATGKSAQIPLFVWLPDAMAGPTPVSALIHAATMVTAGVYMVVRTNAIFSHAPAALTIVALIGGLTAIFAGTIAIAQWDIKKVLAYSTVSQLGYMFLGCGVGGFAAGFFHVVTHAFFKALLFLGSGSVIHAMHHEQDMRNMGGLSKYLKITFATMGIGTLAIAGFPFLSGFFSKDEILWNTRSSPVLPGNVGMILWIMGLLTAGLTAIYMTRMMVLTFFGEERFKKAEHGHDSPKGHGAAHAFNGGHTVDEHHGHGAKPHESPISMTLPLMVLALLSVVGGYVGVPKGLGETLHFPHSTHAFYEFLEPVIKPVPQSPGNVTGDILKNHEEAHNAELIATALSAIIGLLGIGLGYVFFKGNPLRKMPGVLEGKYYIDEIYEAIIVKPLKWISTNGLWKVVDVGIIDGAVNGLASLMGFFSGGLRQLQSGFARFYAAFIFLGALAVIGYFFFGFVR